MVREVEAEEMSRASILAAARADSRQIAGVPLDALRRELEIGVVKAIAVALKAPELLEVDRNGVSPLEAELMRLAFKRITIALWPELVKAFARGAGMTARMPDPELLEKMDQSALVDLLKSLRMEGTRKSIHNSAWSYATRTANLAERIAALSKAKAEAVPA
jgi:hypothetical protein